MEAERERGREEGREREGGKGGRKEGKEGEREGLREGHSYICNRPEFDSIILVIHNCTYSIYITIYAHHLIHYSYVLHMRNDYEESCSTTV